MFKFSGSCCIILTPDLLSWIAYWKKPVCSVTCFGKHSVSSLWNCINLKAAVLLCIQGYVFKGSLGTFWFPLQGCRHGGPRSQLEAQVLRAAAKWQGDFSPPVRKSWGRELYWTLLSSFLKEGEIKGALHSAPVCGGDRTPWNGGGGHLPRLWGRNRYPGFESGLWCQ